MATTSLYFVRSGNINVRSASLNNVCNVSDNWSASAISYLSTTSATAHYLALNSKDVYTSHGPNHRWVGFSLRFLAIGGDKPLPDGRQWLYRLPKQQNGMN